MIKNIEGLCWSVYAGSVLTSEKFCFGSWRKELELLFLLSPFISVGTIMNKP